MSERALKRILGVLGALVAWGVWVSLGGGRIGKGAGFADLELGILRDLGLLKPDTPIVAAVRPVAASSAVTGSPTPSVT